jgi:hypothetical protein
MLHFILTLLGFRRYGPNQCSRCGAPALIIDDTRPWRRYCGPCYTKVARRNQARNS